MATLNDKRTESRRHCGYCGLAVRDDTPAIERFAEQFCSEVHAEEFVAGVRNARMQATARPEAGPTSCAFPTTGQRSWKDYLKRGACWGAPLLLLLAIPLFWSGSATA